MLQAQPDSRVPKSKVQRLYREGYASCPSWSRTWEVWWLSIDLNFIKYAFPTPPRFCRPLVATTLYLSPPSPHLYLPPRNLRYRQRKSSDSESRSNCRLLGLTSFSPGISSAFWTATTLRTWHVNSERYRRDGKKSQDMAFRQSKTWEQYCYL